MQTLPLARQAYSLTQAADGQVLYAEHCASFYGLNLLGNWLCAAWCIGVHAGFLIN